MRRAFKESERRSQLPVHDQLDFPTAGADYDHVSGAHDEAVAAKLGNAVDHHLRERVQLNPARHLGPEG